MEPEKKPNKYLLPVGILVIVALGAYAVVATLRSAANKAVQPVTDLTGELGTQVAQILHPTPTVLPDPMTIVHEVRSLARLETIQYAIEKVVTAESGQAFLDFLFGDRLLFVAHGEVIAGIDLSQLGPDDLWVEGNILYVTLPDAEIFVATLDNEKSYVYDRERGFLTRGSTDLETAARQIAVEEIRKAALEDGILNQASINAENFLSRMLLKLGYQDVIFVEVE